MQTNAAPLSFQLAGQRVPVHIIRDVQFYGVAELQLPGAYRETAGDVKAALKRERCALVGDDFNTFRARSMIANLRANFNLAET